MHQRFKKKWAFSLILFYSILTLPLLESFAVCCYLSLTKKQKISNYFLELKCCFWIKISLVFNKALHNAFFTEKSSLENPFQKHQKWSSLLISFGHVKKRKKRCWEKETKNSAGRIHDKQLKEGPWGNCVIISVQHFFFKRALTFFLHDKFQRPPPSHSSLSPYTAALFHVCYILLSHVVFSYPVLFALPPTFHVYLNVSCPHATQSGCMKKRKDLPWSPSGVPLELGLWSWFGSERMGNA